MEKLRFRVVHVSSEDDEFPASELDTHNPQTKGWQSQRFSDFPQEIGLKIDRGPVRINQIQILSHQSKVAKKVELFVGTGQEYFNAKYKRLGYLSLDDNSRSGYNARELKSVNIDDVASFLKVVVHEPHPNKVNLHNQVGIVAINLQGYYETGASNMKPEGGAGGVRSPPPSVPNPLNDLSIDMGLDPQTAEKLRKLGEAKKRAVEIEDYMTAKQIKGVESDLLRLGSKLTQLETSKRRAVADEDYDRAKEIKDAMDSLRIEIEDKIRAIRIPGLDHGGYETKPSRSQPTDNRSVHNSGAKPPRENSKQIVNVDEQVVGGTGTYAVDYSGSGSNSHGKRVVYEEDHDVHSPSKNKPIDYYEEDEEQPGGFDTRPIRPKKRNLYDDVDPEVDGQEAYNQQQSQGNGQEFPPGQHPFEGLDNRDDLPLPEEFSAKAREVTDLAKVIELIGEYRTRALFSGKCIPLRESCLLKIRRMVEAGEFVESPGHLAAIPALMTIVRVGLDDKISQVYLSAINLLELVIGLMKRENIPKSEAAHLIDPHVTILIERLNDGQTKIRDAAMKTLKFIVANTAVGSTVIANQCLRAVPAKQKTAWRPICNRLQMVLDIINTTGVSHKSGNTVDNVLGFMKNHDTFTHSNGDVRDVTKAICVAMAKIVGPDVIVPQLEPVLRKTQFEDYMLAFGIAAPAPSKGASGVASNDAAPRGGSNMKSPGRKSKEMKESKDDDDAPPNFSTCMFCGTSDPTWNEDALDLHYWKDCTMLAQCPACAQVTEIAGLPNHLQEECEQKEHYVFDEVTGLSVRKDEMDHWNHPAPPADCVYCPLCIASVEDSDDAWLKHLSQVCPKNKRIVVNNKASSRPGSSANRPKSGVAADVRPSTGSERPGTGSARPHTGSNRPGTGSNRPSSSAGAKVDDEVDLYDANFEE